MSKNENEIFLLPAPPQVTGTLRNFADSSMNDPIKNFSKDMSDNLQTHKHAQRPLTISEQGFIYQGMTEEQLLMVDEFAANLRDGRLELPLNDESQILALRNQGLRHDLMELEKSYKDLVDKLHLKEENSVLRNTLTQTLTKPIVEENKNIIKIRDVNNRPHDCDYTGITINYSKIDNLSPVWAMMLVFQDNLNRHIGFNRWKRYVSANFWNYITTPINFTITLFTAISAGQAGTGSAFLSNTQLFAILFASFILSTINTFFKLKDKAETSYKIAKDYDKFGSDFEEIYYTNILKQEDVAVRLEKYSKLHKSINEYIASETFENVDYIADALFICFRRICYCFITNTRQVNSNESFWYLDGVKNEKTKELMLNTQKLFVYDFTRIEPKSKFFGLFSNNDYDYDQDNGSIMSNENYKKTPLTKNDTEKEVGCFINEKNRLCCKRMNIWCDKYCMRHIRCCYNTVCCCECCEEIKEDADIEKGKGRHSREHLSMSEIDDITV